MTISIIFNRRKTASATKNGSVELLVSHNGVNSKLKVYHYNN